MGHVFFLLFFIYYFCGTLREFLYVPSKGYHDPKIDHQKTQIGFWQASPPNFRLRVFFVYLMMFSGSWCLLMPL